MSRFHDQAGVLPWEKQPTEGDRHYLVFELFRDGARPRSVRAAWAELCRREGRPVTRRAPGAIERASTLWSWRRRAEAFDVYEAANEHAELEEARLAARRARVSRLRALALRVDGALPRLVLAEPRDVLRAVELVHEEERLELHDRPEDRATRGEGVAELPDLNDRLLPEPEPRQTPQKEPS